MKPIIIFAIVIIHMALISYGIGVITEQIKHRVTRRILFFLALGLTFDLIATVCMVVGAGKGYLTRHSILGYSCLLTMAVDSALVLRHRLKCGDQQVPRALHLFSRYAYCWWVIGAYLLGGFLAYLSVSAAS
jgi:hypothetical protein